MAISFHAMSENLLSALVLRFWGSGITPGDNSNRFEPVRCTRRRSPVESVYPGRAEQYERLRGPSPELPPQLRQQQKDVLCFAKGVWTPLEPSKCLGP